MPHLGCVPGRVQRAGMLHELDRIRREREMFTVSREHHDGQLVKLATERGGKTQRGMKIGICGEHGGDDAPRCCRVVLRSSFCDRVTYRARKRDVIATKRWREFRAANAALLSAIGVPEELLSNGRAFAHFLMHGAHPASSFRIDAARIDESERSRIERLVLRYLRAGFADPGISILPPSRLRRLRDAASNDEAVLDHELAWSFPDDHGARARTLLDQYAGPEASRVRIAIVMLCDGTLASIESLIDGARRDPRDVLAWAESPASMRDGPPARD